MRNFWILVVLLLWAVLGWKMCTDYSECCPTDKIVEEANTGTSIAAVGSACDGEMICFTKSNCEPTYGSNFERFRDSLITLVTSGKILRITGIYNTDEEYSGTSSNLGTCRAESIRTSFEALTDDQLITTGQLTVGRTMTAGELYQFDIIDQAPSVGTNPPVGAQAVIYFPYNSTRKLDNRDIERYLDKVAIRVKDSGEKVQLTGHTDDKGRAVKNIELGQRRANVIADYLMGQGVLRSQIVATSRGESEPTATNKTEVGRAKNRRTELQIIK